MLLVISQISFGQYTDVINSNNPGKSIGAYSVGRKVVQLESEFFYENSEHLLLRQRQQNYGVNYEVRYGVWREQFEAVLEGTLLYDKHETTRIPFTSETNFGFYKNTLGAKYLLYNPTFQEKPNLYSWKANAKFNWRKLLPAISVYAGANFFSKNRFLYEITNDDYYFVTPKLVASFQSHPMRNMVLVANLVGDNFLSPNRQLSYIFTLTHNLNNPRWSICIENEGVMSKYYTDTLVRLGVSFLATEELQFNTFLGASAKTTPTRYTAALGISYRIYNRHKDVEFREKMEAREKDNQEDAKIFNFDTLNP